MSQEEEEEEEEEEEGEEEEMKAKKNPGRMPPRQGDAFESQQQTNSVSAVHGDCGKPNVERIAVRRH